MSTDMKVETCPRPDAPSARPSGRRIGMLANHHDSDETRLFLTPETCGRLISDGWEVCMETDAASPISYADTAYADYGVEIVNRADALGCDIVLSYAPIPALDVEKMHPGAVLLCMFSPALFSRTVIEALKERVVCTIALDEIESHNGVQVFANIVDDVDGRAAM